MNEIDKHLMENLTKNARKSFRSMAQEMNKSTDTMINHYKKLSKEGGIRGTTVVMDANKIGYEGVCAFYMDSISSKEVNSDTILEELIKMPNIIVATKTVGEHDLLALAVIHNIYHLMDLKKEIAKIEGVTNISTSIWPAGKEIAPEYFII